MLVLSRKTGQRTIIAGNVRVVVLSVQGDRVKLGFDGPADVPIHREEVLERIVREEKASESASYRENDGPRSVTGRKEIRIQNCSLTEGD